jgi:hypothetical protein
MLEYAANSGKPLRRELIVVVLHNQASVYLKIWQLDHCSEYLEGLIFNYDNYIKQTPRTSASLLDNPHSLHCTQRLVRYCIQACAVNSNLGNHNHALELIKKAYNLMQECFFSSAEEIACHISRYLEHASPLITELMILLAEFPHGLTGKINYREKQRMLITVAEVAISIWN